MPFLVFGTHKIKVNNSLKYFKFLEELFEDSNPDDIYDTIPDYVKYEVCAVFMPFYEALPPNTPLCPISSTKKCTDDLNKLLNKYETNVMHIIHNLINNKRATFDDIFSSLEYLGYYNMELIYLICADHFMYLPHTAIAAHTEYPGGAPEWNATMNKIATNSKNKLEVAAANNFNKEWVDHCLLSADEPFIPRPHELPHLAEARNGLAIAAQEQTADLSKIYETGIKQVIDGFIADTIKRNEQSIIEDIKKLASGHLLIQWCQHHKKDGKKYKSLYFDLIDTFKARKRKVDKLFLIGEIDKRYQYSFDPKLIYNLFDIISQFC